MYTPCNMKPLSYFKFPPSRTPQSFTSIISVSVQPNHLILCTYIPIGSLNTFEVFLLVKLNTMRVKIWVVQVVTPSRRSRLCHQRINKPIRKNQNLWQDFDRLHGVWNAAVTVWLYSSHASPAWATTTIVVTITPPLPFIRQLSVPCCTHDMFIENLEIQIPWALGIFFVFFFN